MDLEREIDSGIGFGRMYNLVTGIGPDSALGRSLDPHWEWSTDTELLAILIEVLDRHDRNTAILAGYKKDKLGPPVKIKRPYERQKTRSKIANEQEVKKKNSDLSALKAMLGDKLEIVYESKES